MGTNKFENFIFSIICCILMVFTMTWYNGLLESGLKLNVLKTFFTFIPVLVIAFIIDWFLVGPVAKSLAFKMVSHNDSLVKKILVISTSMVIGMSGVMSILSVIVHGNYGANFLGTLGVVWGRNFIFALPLNMLIVGPLARFIFLKIFPEKITIKVN